MLNSGFNHDLLTPLKCIIQFASTVLNNFPDEKLQKNMNTIIYTTRLLLAQVKGQLDQNLISKGILNVNLECFGIFSVINDCLEMLKGQASHKNVSLVFKHPEAKDQFLMIDSLRVQQVLINLIVNAVKFSDSGRKVTISLSYFEVSQSPGEVGVEIKVIDKGIGISEADQKLIFDAYFRT